LHGTAINVVFSPVDHTEGGSVAAEPTQPEKSVITKTARDLGELHDGLQQWLATRLDLPDGHDLRITALHAPESNGMSSLTVLFDAAWTEEGSPRTESLVARVAPEPTSVPVFPTYDLGAQFEIIRLVGDRSSVPLPRLFWYEGDDSHIGAPFFVMGRVDGQVPPDNMPYNLGSWVTEASAAERATMQEASVEVLAAVHAIDDPTTTFAFLAPPEGKTGLRQHFDSQRDYYDWTVSCDGTRVPIVERALEWLEAHWPGDPGPDVLSWGDARIGNTMYRDFRPVAVFDWEMAALAPREVDLAWFIFLHRFFEDIAATYDLPGLPDFLRKDDVIATYQRASGYTPRDMDFYLTYASLRHAIVMSQTKRRAIHFGEDVLPEDPDDMVLHRATMEQLLAGTYVWP
jgi:aminoglycoside phosphotransferase (APT) family kinase protein